MDPKQELLDDITGEIMRAKWDEDCMVVRNIGALVRLVREVLRECVWEDPEGWADWDAEALALVGEEPGKEST